MPKPDLITTSGLSPEIQNLIRQVVSRTRLWKRERHSFTLELLAHFHDGLEAGRSAEDLIKTFGDPKLTATLVRRAKKRNRPLWWHFARRSLQVIGIFILLYLGQMALLLTGRPEIKVDYAAQICAKADAVPQSDRAWPIYRDAWQLGLPLKINWTPKPPATRPATPELRKAFTQPLYTSKPGDPTWDQAVALLHRHSGLLEAAHAAALKLGLGITLRERRDPQSDYRKVFPPVGPSPYALLDVMDSTLDCRENVAISTTINLFQIDIRLAATQNDPARIIRDCRTIASLYRQMSEARTLISELMRLIAVGRTDATLADIITSQPDLLSAQQQVELLHILSSMREAIAVSLDSQRLVWQDLVQRIYTDNGNGDGRLTHEGADCFVVVQGTGKFPHITSALTLPLLSACLASRRDITQAASEQYDLLERGLKLPLPELLNAQANGTELDRKIMEMNQSMATAIHYWPLSMTIPQFGGVGKDIHIARALHDALSVALALEAFRKDTGTYPKTLNELIPHYLPAIPTDPLANQPLLYTLHNGKPTIYAPGQDGLNHGGAPTKTPPTEIPTSADWILFPPPNP